ncbi:hypothetical protein V8C34DRAFT_221840 [Trichoderma compactum]
MFFFFFFVGARLADSFMASSRMSKPPCESLPSRSESPMIDAAVRRDVVGVLVHFEPHTQKSLPGRANHWADDSTHRIPFQVGGNFVNNVGG